MPSKVKRACMAGGYHGIQFVCWVAIGLLAVFIAFGFLWSLFWQRYE